MARPLLDKSECEAAAMSLLYFKGEMLNNDSQNAFCESKVLNCESIFGKNAYICSEIVTKNPDV